MVRTVIIFKLSGIMQRHHSDKETLFITVTHKIYFFQGEWMDIERSLLNQNIYEVSTFIILINENLEILYLLYIYILKVHP